jgi:hypothetical protein
MIHRTLRTGSESYERTCPVLQKEEEMYTFEPVLITDSQSCENLRSVFSPVLPFIKVSIDSHCENRDENRVSI